MTWHPIWRGLRTEYFVPPWFWVSHSPRVSRSASEAKGGEVDDIAWPWGQRRTRPHGRALTFTPTPASASTSDVPQFQVLHVRVPHKISFERKVLLGHISLLSPHDWKSTRLLWPATPYHLFLLGFSQQHLSTFKLLYGFFLYFVYCDVVCTDAQIRVEKAGERVRRSGQKEATEFCSPSFSSS